MSLMWQVDCLLCSGTYVLGASMDGLLRHLGSKKHLKKWVEHSDSPPGMLELRHSIAEKWVAWTKDPNRESYIEKRTITKRAQAERAQKLTRKQTVQTITAALTLGGQAPLSPGNAAAFGAALAAASE